MNVYNSFIRNCPNRATTKCPAVGEWMSCGTSTQQNIIQQDKEMSYSPARVSQLVGAPSHTSKSHEFNS